MTIATHETGNKEKITMGARIITPLKGVRKTSAWPYTEMPESKKPRVRKDGWVLAMSIEPELSGLVTFYPAGTDFPVPMEDRTSKRQILHIDNGSIWGKKITTRPFYQVDTKEQCERFATTFCSLGYTTNEKLLPHQGGAFWGFNWSSLTVATVHIASQVADHYFNDRYDEAWTVGKAFGDQIHAAENAYWEAQGK
jgi:hypothetical protein